MKRLLALLITVMLLLPAISEGMIEEDSSSYETGLKWIQSSFSYKDRDNVLNALESITKSPRAEFYITYKTWLTAIKLIHDANYANDHVTPIDEFKFRTLAEAKKEMRRIADDQAFIDELGQHNLPSPEAVITYISGLEAEKEGNYAEAMEAYNAVITLFDASDRLTELEWSIADGIYYKGMEYYNAGDYYKAYSEFLKLDADYYSPDDESAKVLRNKALDKHKEFHTFAPATCERPATCPECGDTQGDPLGHDYAPATCTQPKTCVRCGATEGEPLGHEWKDATCTEAGVCTRCNAVGTDPTGHDWKEATCTEPRTCAICGATEGGPLDHNWQPATYERPEMCSRCGLTRGEKLKPKLAAGDIVTYGAYPQTASGTDNTPIEWLVLDVQDEKALLISKYALDWKPYNTTYIDVTWEKCTLRTWLNEDFINKAFNSAEQSAIVLTNVDNSKSQEYSEWSTNGGNNTQDKVFLLSYAEANKYLDVTWENQNNYRSRTSPTAYAKNQGAYTISDYKTNEGADACVWWLRSPGCYQDCAAYVHIDGSLNYYNVYSTDNAVRPALWIDLKTAGLE